MKNFLLFLLLTSGFHAFAQDVDALHEAIKQRDIPQIQALIDAGVDVNGIGISHHTAFTLNLSEYAAAPKTLEIAELLLAAGADINVKNDEGKTARNIALEKDAADIVALLDAATQTTE